MFGILRRMIFTVCHAVKLTLEVFCSHSPVVGGFRLALLLMIAVSAGTFACVLALPAHSLHDAHQIDALE